VDALVRVKGVGPKMLDRLRPYLTVDELSHGLGPGPEP
jgi:hypothetical protein